MTNTRVRVFTFRHCQELLVSIPNSYAEDWQGEWQSRRLCILQYWRGNI